MPDLIIRNGTLVDGTGAPPRSADIAVEEGRIREVVAPGTLTDAAVGVHPGLEARRLDLRHGDGDGLLTATAEQLRRRQEPAQVLTQAPAHDLAEARPISFDPEHPGQAAWASSPGSSRASPLAKRLAT